MKKLAVISSYCNTQEKKEVLIKNIKTLKENNLDILVISPTQIDVDCDFLFITKENPILGPDKKAWSYWRICDYKDGQIKLNQHMYDYGWASLYQIKKACQIATTFEYQIFYLLIYDLIITQEIIDEINTEKCNITYPRKNHNGHEIFPATFHFSIFNKELLKKITEKIKFEDYCYNNGFAEDFIEKWCEELEIEKSKLIVQDSINNNSNLTLYNYSTENSYKFFIGENKKKEVLIYFYGVNESVELTLNNDTHVINQKEDLIITQLKMNEISKIEILCDNKKINYNYIKDKIIWNEIEIL